MYCFFNKFLPSDIESIIDKNFKNLTGRIQNKIFKAILKPTVQKLENNLKLNLNEVRIHQRNLENTKLIKSHKILVFVIRRVVFNF